MNQLAIDIQGLTKIFDQKTVVDNLTLQVRRGAIFGFLGANGSGKTTMIRMISGLLTPTHGKGLCLGYDINTQQGEIKKKIGYMPQKFSLYLGLTVYQNLQFIADIYQIEKSKETIREVLQELQLDPYKNTPASNLSGGWKQSLALACCILHKPELLFLDEPTAGVDPKARKDFWNYLHELASSRGTTVLVTTHYMDEAEKCTDLAYIALGQLLYSGPTKNLIPFSKIKTYLVASSEHSVNQLSEKIRRLYPELLVAVVNNELRVSSSNLDLLAKFVDHPKDYSLQEVRPSFEEVFIGLMR